MHFGFRNPTGVILCIVALLLGTGAQAAVTIDWVTVGGAGNTADSSGYGAVTYTYKIGKFEITNAQYAEFLNAVAGSTDTYHLYNTNMADSGASLHGGIKQNTLQSGDFIYTTLPGRANLPVNWVSFYDCLRFINWLYNSQPTGAQDATTTEGGAYTFNGESSVGPLNLVVSVWFPTEDEWYKAAYYDPASKVYYAYPAGTSTAIGCVAAGATANRANCANVVGDLTDVGTYTGSPSPNGTFDQGGNVLEWNETVVSGSNRGQRGGTFIQDPTFVGSSYRTSDSPTFESDSLGFRVAGYAVPEPGRALLALTALLTLAGLRRLRCAVSPAPDRRPNCKAAKSQ